MVVSEASSFHIVCYAAEEVVVEAAAVSVPIIIP